jgi:hypothetical protein
LQEIGVLPAQISFLKPDSVRENVSGVLSLREGNPLAVFLMLYLIQIQGRPAYDLLDIFTRDPKTGDYIARLDQELERLFAAQLAAVAVAKAA